MDRSPARPGAARRALPAVAVVAHLAVGVLPYAASGLVAPPAGVGLLWLSWLVLLVAVVVLARRRRLLALAVPAVALLWWVLVVTAGDLLLGWTA